MKVKGITIICFISLILLTTNLLAATNITAKVSSSTSEIEGGQDVIITLKFDEYQEVKKGLNAYKATLVYDKAVFEEVIEEDFKCENEWEKLKYNKETGEFVAIKRAGSITPEDVVKVTLSSKEGIKAGKTDVKITNIVTSEGEKDINLNETKVTIDIVEEQEEKPEDPKKPEKITSDKYEIKDGYILRILPKTTVNEFKKNVVLENVTTEPQMVFTDENGNVLSEDSMIKTGTKLKVGTTLQFTLIVIGDTDKDSEITINDMAEIKLHLIATKLLEGVKLKAADIDNDNEITINDLAKIKLVLIELLELK